MAVVTSDGVPYHEILPPEVEDEKAAMVASKDYVTLTELPAREAYTRDAIRWIQGWSETNSSIVVAKEEAEERGFLVVTQEAAVSVTRRRQRLQTSETRGREDSSGGRRRRIMERMLSSSSRGAGDAWHVILILRFALMVWPMIFSWFKD